MPQAPESPFPYPVTLTGIDENQGCVEGNLILRKTQGTEEVGKVEYGADELAAACRNGDEENKHATLGCLEQGANNHVERLLIGLTSATSQFPLPSPKARNSSTPPYLPSKKTVWLLAL